MKISFHRPSLLSACKLASQAASSKVKPILRNLLLTCGQESTLQATDTEIGIRVALRAIQCDSEGSVLVDPKMIEAMREMPGDDATLEVDEKKIRLKGPSSKFDFAVQDVTHFPAFESAPNGGYAKVLGTDFDKLVNWTSFAADQMDVKFGVTKGVLIEINDEIVFVGLDGRRMSVVNVPHQGEPVMFDRTVVPLRALTLARSAQRQDGSKMEMHFTKEAAFFRSGDILIYSKLIEGKYPKYQTAIPKKHRASYTINAKEFHGIIRQASIATTDLSKRVRFTFEDGKLASSITSDMGHASAEMPVEMNGETFSAEFAPQFLADMASRVEGDIQFGGDGFNQKVTMRYKNWLYVVSPMWEEEQK